MVKAFNIEIQMVYLIFAVFYVCFGYIIAYLLSSAKHKTKRRPLLIYQNERQSLESSGRNLSCPRITPISTKGRRWWQSGPSLTVGWNVWLWFLWYCSEHPWLQQDSQQLPCVSQEEGETQGGNMTVCAVLSLKPIRLVVPHEWALSPPAYCSPQVPAGMGAHGHLPALVPSYGACFIFSAAWQSHKWSSLHVLPKKRQSCQNFVCFKSGRNVEILKVCLPWKWYQHLQPRIWSIDGFWFWSIILSFLHVLRFCNTIFFHWNCSFWKLQKENFDNVKNLSTEHVILPVSNYLWQIKVLKGKAFFGKFLSPVASLSALFEMKNGKLRPRVCYVNWEQLLLRLIGGLKLYWKVSVYDCASRAGCCRCKY